MEKLFFLFTILLIGSVIMTITTSNPIHSVFWLVLIFIYSAGLLISIGFEFLALIIIIIYVGAIVILFLFVIMMLDIIQLKKITSINNIIPLIIIIFINIILETWWLFNNKINLIKFEQQYNWNIEYITQINIIGINLYLEYSFPLLILSLLLLIAMIGAIILTLELGVITKKQFLINQHQRNNSWI